MPVEEVEQRRDERLLVLGDAREGAVQRALPAVVPVEVLQVVDHRWQRRGQFVIHVAGLQPVRPSVVEEEVVLRGHAGEQIATAEQRREVRPVDLVETRYVEVDAERLHVDPAVRGVGHAVDIGKRAGRAHTCRDGGDILQLADQVRAVREGDQPSALVEQRLQVLEAQRVAFLVAAPLAHHDARLLQCPPRADVGLVVEVGHDDLIALAPQRPQGRRGKARQGRRRRADDGFTLAAAEKPLRGPVPCSHARRGLSRQRVAGPQLHHAGAHVVGSGVDHPTERHATARVVEERPLGMGPQRREAAAHEVEVEHARSIRLPQSARRGHAIGQWSGLSSSGTKCTPSRSRASRASPSRSSSTAGSRGTKPWPRSCARKAAPLP